MKKRTRNNRGWAMILLMLAIALQVQAQYLITLKLETKPLPAALKLIEREGGSIHTSAEHRWLDRNCHEA